MIDFGTSSLIVLAQQGIAHNSIDAADHAPCATTNVAIASRW